VQRGLGTVAPGEVRREGAHEHVAGAVGADDEAALHAANAAAARLVSTPEHARPSL
jgi:hypothetical protein